MTEQGQPFAEDRADQTAGDAAADEGVVRTGVAEVDRVLSDVEGLGERPLEEHLGAYERAHESLRSALDARPDQSA